MPQLKIIRNLKFVARSQEFSKFVARSDLATEPFDARSSLSRGRLRPENDAAKDMVDADDDASGAARRPRSAIGVDGLRSGRTPRRIRRLR